MTVYAYAGGILSAVGHDPVIGVRDISGDVSFTPDDPGSAQLHLTIAATSLTVQNDASDKDRREMEKAMHDEVLESARYGQIGYDATQARVQQVSEGRYRIDIEGQLALHGVTRAQPVSAQVFLTGDTLRAQGEVTLRQTDFNIKLVSAAGGTLKVKDALKVTFDLLARKAG
jgi:polyisoprenoid-binding protein YceI